MRTYASPANPALAPGGIMNMNDTNKVWPSVRLNILTVRRLANPEHQGFKEWRDYDLKHVEEACRAYLEVIKTAAEDVTRT